MNTTVAVAPKPLTFALLRLLADGEFHSGEVLARQLNVSRASVNNALQGTESYGLILYSVRGRGYRLAESPQWLDAERIRAALRTPEVFHLDVVDSAASSNTLLMQRAAHGAPSGSVLALEWQSAGRGRLGRPWHSGLGNALTFSLLWRFETGIAALSGLSLAVGLAMLRALRKFDVADIGLKWPNDVVTGMTGKPESSVPASLTSPGQRKLAGILIEAQGDMLGPSLVVIGIGLNLRLPEAVARRIDQPVSDLARTVAVMPERNRLLALLLQELADMLAVFAQQGFAALRAEWESCHVYQDRQVSMLLPDGTQVEGTVRGVTDDGGLRVETRQGVRVFNAGEISLRGA